MKGSKSLMDLFSNLGPRGQYVIERYQRKYSWGKNQIEEFIATIGNIHGKKYNIGTITVNEIDEVNHIDTQVVDGQQRIITMFLFLCAIRDNTSDPELREEITDIISKRGKPYVTSSNSQDDDTIKYVFYGEEMTTKAITKNNVFKMFRIITNYVKSCNCQALYDKLRLLSVNEAKVDDEDEAYANFIDLNTFGLKVPSGDVIPSMLYPYVSEMDRIEKENCIKKISFIKDTFDTKVLPDASAFYSRFMVIKGENVKKEKAIANEFKRFVNRNMNNVSKIVDDLYTMCEFEKSIFTATTGNNSLDYELKILPLENESIVRLIDVLFCKISHYSSKITEKEKLETLRIWKKILVLRELSIQRPTMHHNVVSEIVRKACDKFENGMIPFAKAFQETVLDCKQTNFDFFYNSKESIIENIKTSCDFYKNQKRYTKTIFFRLNIDNCYGDALFNKSDVTIEHIMPQNGNENNKNLNRIGNLTLVTQSFNSMLKDKPFSEKRDILASTQFRLNRYFADIEEWNDSEIEKRTDILARRIADLYYI